VWGLGVCLSVGLTTVGAQNEQETMRATIELLRGQLFVLTEPEIEFVRKEIGVRPASSFLAVQQY
jgi:hypothetical protein